MTKIINKTTIALVSLWALFSIWLLATNSAEFMKMFGALVFGLILIVTLGLYLGHKYDKREVLDYDLKTIKKLESEKKKVNENDPQL